MTDVPLLEKWRLASKHRIGFAIALIPNGAIPLAALSFKVAAMQDHSNGTVAEPWPFSPYWLIVVIGGVASALSLYSFGRGVWGSDRMGTFKTILFLVLFEASWLSLPYEWPPNLEGASTNEVLWFWTAAFALVLAIMVNAFEGAALVASKWEDFEMKKSALRTHKALEKVMQSRQVLDESQAFIRGIENICAISGSESRMPRIRRDGDTMILFDAKTEESTILYPAPQEGDALTNLEQAFNMAETSVVSNE